MQRFKHVVVLAPSGHLNTDQPTTSLVAELAERGFHVDVLGVENINVQRIAFDNPSVQVFYLPWAQKRLREPRVWLTLAFFPWALVRCVFSKYQLIIGAGLKGLFSASFLSLLIFRPFVYLCLELYMSKDNKSVLDKAAKKLERWANRRASFTIIQDEQRAKLLSADNGVPSERIMVLPNAPRGAARISRSNFLRERFVIDEETRIILYAGSITPWAKPLELVKAAQDWPLDWVLVIHSARPPLSEAHRRYFEEMKAANHRHRAIFSLEPLPWNRVAELVSSADVGVALYDHSNENMYYTGLASGKLAQYLRYGVPAIVTDTPGINDVVMKYKCGEIVRDDLSDIAFAIGKILSADYHLYCESSVRCFEDIVSLENYMQKIVLRLANITDKTRRMDTPHHG